MTDLFNYSRREASEVNIGATPMGGANPIRIQSMTNTITTQANWKIIDDTHLLLTTGTEQMTVTIEASGKVAFTSETIEVNSPAYTRIGISLKEQSKDGYIRLTMRTK